MHIKSLRLRSHRSFKVDENVPPAAVARLRKVEAFDHLRAAGCRKLRWRVSGRKGGKSGGMRVIYYFRNAADQIILLLAYDHRTIDDLAPGQKRRLAGIVRQLK